jgi:hypothetical protein
MENEVIVARVMTTICVVIVPPKECFAMVRAAGAGQGRYGSTADRRSVLILPMSNKMKSNCPLIL